MKLTWTDQQALAQELAGLSDSATNAILNRDMNTGAAKFIAQLGREYNRKSRFTDIVAGQQYYQLPMDGHRIKELIVSTGSWLPPMEQIPDEFAWRMMNMLKITGIPTHYFIRGYNEFGLYPTPSLSLSEGIEAVFSPRHTNMTENDFTTGTVTVTQNSATITHSATGFNEKMANLGMWFQVTDGSDENWYQIASFTSSNTLELGNVYQGPSGSGISFRIGQVMDLPEEFLEAPCDYAAWRFYLKRGIIGANQAQVFQALFETALEQAKDEYGQASESQVVSAEPRFRIYNPWRGDSPPHISA